MLQRQTTQGSPLTTAPSRVMAAPSRGAFLKQTAATAVTLGAGALAATGGTGVAAAAATSIPAVNLVGRAAVTIDVAHPGSVAFSTRLVGLLIQQFEAEHPTIKVNLIPTASNGWQQYFAEMLTRIAGGNIPDIMRVEWEGVALFAQHDALRPLDDLLARDAAYAGELHADTAPLLWRALTHNGQQLALPFTWLTTVLWYNTGLLARPAAAWTGRDFLAMCARLKKQGRYGVGLPGYDALWGLEAWSAAAGGALLDKSGTRSTATEQGNQAAWTFLYDVVHTYKYAPRQSANFPYDTFFESGRLGSVVDIARSPVRGFQDDGFCSATSCVADVQTLPVLGGGPRKTLVVPDGFPIMRASKHPEAAWEFVKYLSSRQGMATYMRGRGKYLPTRRSLAYDGRYMAPPAHYRTFYDALLTEGTPPSAPPAASYFEVQSTAYTWYSRMMAGEASPSAALAGLDRDLNAILSRPV